MIDEKTSYEAAMEELRIIVDQLERNIISMDELAEKVRRATALVAYCQNKLRKTEGEMNTLFEDDA